MFLLFGLRTKDHMAGTRMMICEICGWEAPQSVLRRSTKFTLFFIPLFPVKPSREYLVCGHCRGFREAGHAHNLAHRG
ncbi:zinc ribbon domain-containing protein [Actinoplanes sp. NBC_00393]|uniref:zinc-ribbon domain-containing protein n=1 Tax=Actinoplanes sp. NBC_00393 TaxID=2975953 RepID=UPI002E1B8B55